MRGKGNAVLALVAAALLALCSGLTLAADGSEELSSADADLSASLEASVGTELLSERTATSETYLLPSGGRETRIYEAPIHYRTPDGDWKSIDEGLEQTGEGITNGSNSFDIALPERLSASPVRLAYDGRWVTVELLGQNSASVELKDGIARYESADGRTNFELSGLANGIKEDIEIRDGSQPSTFHFDLDVSGGLEPFLAAGGSIEIRDEEGNVHFVLPAPVIADSAARPDISNDAVHFELEAAAKGHWRLAVKADSAWLDDADRVWPVTIDPTLTVPSPSLDCTIGSLPTPSGWGECGSAGRQELQAAYSQKEDQVLRSLLRFDLSAIPPDVDITSATLGLYSPSAVENTKGLALRRATKSWSKRLNWRRYGTADADPNLEFLWATPGGDYTAEGADILTSSRGSQAGWWVFSSESFLNLVRRWYAQKAGNPNGLPNQGVLVKLLDDNLKECLPNGEKCNRRYATFSSSASVNPSLRPYMSVSYYPKAPSTSKVSSPSDGTRSARRFKLKATWQGESTTGVTYQLKLDGWKDFETIPAGLVRNVQGQQISWPLSVNGNQVEPVYFDAASYPNLNFDSALQGIPSIQIRALFDGPTGVAGYSVPVNVALSRFVGGTRDATTQIGPGSVDLVTGSYTITRTDVSIPGFGSALEFGRTRNSRDVTSGASGVLGEGWTPSAVVESAGGSMWRSVRDVVWQYEDEEEEFVEEKFAVLTDLEGYEYSFELVGSAYQTPAELSGWELLRQDATHLVLADPGGNRTTFDKGSGPDYLPTLVSQPGGNNNKTQMVYQLVGGVRRLSTMIAPSAAGVDCTVAPLVTLGCRSLVFSYKPATTWGAPASIGDRLASITYYGPANATTMSQWEVAKYAYNANGLLIEQWDPRVSPALKEKYAYEAGLLSSLTPPGEEPWTFSYYPKGEEFRGGRLKCVKRASLLSSPTVAQTTLVYGVPLSGSGAPYDMSLGKVAEWGQETPPFEATAVFPPDQVPGSPPSSYSRATLYYTDAEGQLVNTATPAGAGTSAASISTVEGDEHGNIVRELSAQNRLRALAAGSASVTRSHELETKRVFSVDGTEMQEELGPLHQVRLQSGATAQARMHKVVKYNEGIPESLFPNPHLPTKETVGASIPGQGIDVDQRITETRYNTTLRKPVEVSVDPSGLNLRTNYEYDPISGLPTERRLPGAVSGGNVHATATLYYAAGAHPTDSSCGNKPAWANLPCKTGPVAQPGTPGLPALLVTRYVSYSALGKPLEVNESPGGAGASTRKTLMTYDSAGRELTQTQEGGGTAIPKAETLYSSTTGRPTIQRFVCQVNCAGFDNQAVTTAYDSLGRVTSYQDADGNTATTTYDLLGRPVSTNDGKGTQTRVYDPTSALLTELQDSAAGIFTASYDADGSLVKQALPNGLIAETTYNEVGEPTHLTYNKTTMCSVNCIWLDFSAERSIHGQVVAQNSTLSSQGFSYDATGRLKQVSTRRRAALAPPALTAMTKTRTGQRL